MKEKNAKRVCTIYQDDDFGLEVMRGAEAGLKAMSMELVEKTSFKRGATDFSSQVAKMKSSNCEVVVLGTIIRETIGTIGESRKTGFSPTFLSANAAYTNLIPKLGGKAMDGMTVPPDIFGSAEFTFSGTKRLGTDASRLSQIQDGRWRVISEYTKPSP